MLVDKHTGKQLAPPKLYNEAQSAEAVAAAKARTTARQSCAFACPYQL